MKDRVKMLYFYEHFFGILFTIYLRVGQVSVYRQSQKCGRRRKMARIEKKHRSAKRLKPHYSQSLNVYFSSFFLLLNERKSYHRKALHFGSKRSVLPGTTERWNSALFRLVNWTLNVRVNRLHQSFLFHYYLVWTRILMYGRTGVSGEHFKNCGCF